MNVCQRIVAIAFCSLVTTNFVFASTNLVFDTRGNIIGSYVSGNTASYNKMQSTLSGVYYKKAGDLGYTPVSQKDGTTGWSPKVTSTIDAVSGVAGTAATTISGVLLAGATAPGWVGLAITVGVSTALGYVVNLGINSLAKWLFRSDNQIDESGEPTTVPTTSAMNAGGAFWKVSFHSGGVNIDLAGGDGEAVARQGYYEYRAQTNQNTSTSPTCSVGGSSVMCSPINATLQPTGAPASCGPGTLYNYTKGTCGGYTFTAPASVPSKTTNLQTAIADLPAADKSKPLNPAIVAAVANQLWIKAASQPGYQGMPYSYANPITESDVSTWQQSNPSEYPTVEEFTSPMPSGSTTGSPWSLPVSGQPVGTQNGSQTTPTGTTNPSTQPLANLGADPGIGSPTLETTPTAQQILAPILNLVPSLRSFSATAHVGSCPRPSFTLFGQSHVMDAHCTLIEAQKPTIQAAMAFAWAAIALFIILSA